MNNKVKIKMSKGSNLAVENILLMTNKKKNNEINKIRWKKLDIHIYLSKTNRLFINIVCQMIVLILYMNFKVYLWNKKVIVIYHWKKWIVHRVVVDIA